MKNLFYSLFISLVLLSCNDESGSKPGDADSSTLKTETKVISRDTTSSTDTPIVKSYSNQRFKDVTAEKIASNTYRIRGKGQIFEASFGWVIEDGHNELKKGFSTTDAGAPEWGAFDFQVQAIKKQANSTLHLVLFETSAKDGSRQHELAIPLE